MLVEQDERRPLVERLKSHAQGLGFSMLGITPAQPSPRLEAFLRWIKAGLHGEMDYLAREDRLARRRDPGVIVPHARSMLIAALDYYSLVLPDAVAHDPARGRISNYAWAADYHHVMLPQLEALADALRQETGAEAATRAYTDTGAILERSHAEQAGLGFIGKNTMLINPRRGSFFFLGEIITNVELLYEEPDPMPGCGSCTRCLSACPTQAFTAPYVLDARRCISYLSIELKGFIPVELRPLMGNWVYGCDVCQEVCPWQRFAQPQWQSVFGPIDLDRAAPPLTDLLALDDGGFAARYQGSAIYRIKRDRLVRNACVVAGNSGLPAMIPHLLPLLDDHSPLVRGHAAWALGHLDAPREHLAAALSRETDEQVRLEIQSALAAA